VVRLTGKTREPESWVLLGIRYYWVLGVRYYKFGLGIKKPYPVGAIAATVSANGRPYTTFHIPPHGNYSPNP